MMTGRRHAVWAVLVASSLTARGWAAETDTSTDPSQTPSAECCDTRAGAACDDPCEKPWNGGDDPYWTATADAQFLHRSTTRGQSLLVDPLGKTDLLNSSDLAFSTEAGPRLGLIRHGQCGWDFEVSYFSIDGWKSQANFASVPGGVAILNMDQALPLPVSSVGFEYGSRLYSTEFNVRHAVNDWLTGLAGFRAVELDENYEADGMQSIGQSFSNTIRTHNHLYGFQIGGEANLVGNGRFRLDSVAKAGIYSNSADQRDALLRPASVVDAAAASTSTAFVGELGLMGTFQLTDHLAMRCGYEVIWLDGAALAPRQIPVTNLGTGVASVDTSGNLVYHGASAGLELRW